MAVTTISAPNVEGLPERSITDFAEGDFQRTGVRGSGGEIGMQARVSAFGAVIVIEAWGTGSEVERRPLRPGLPTIDIVFVNEGEFEYLDGSEWRVSSGPLMIAPSGLPRRVRFLGPWRFVVVRIPREALLAYVPMLNDEVGVYSELTVTERAMQGFLEQAVAGEELVSEGESRTVDRLVLDMAGTLVLGRQGAAWPQGTPRAVVRERALAEIAGNADDVRFTPQALAGRIGVSLRHLQAVFAEAESSVAAEIRRERARVARSVLQDARFDALDVREVAAQSGFGSPASMRRALDELYGVGPKELRIAR